MARGNLANCMAVIFPFEGGFTADRRDPGNWTGGKVGVGVLKGTNMGIAANSFPNLDIANLTKAQAAEIYRTKYWNPVRGDDLPAGVDLATMDGSVNSGVSRGAKWLQKAVGAKQDGVVGAETLRLAASKDGRAVVKTICSTRLSFMQGLAIWKTFKGGWSRRVATVEAKGVAMWLGAHSVTPSQELRAEAKAADKKATTQKTAAGGAGGSGAAVGGGDAAMTGDVNWMLIAALVVGVGIVVALLLLKAKQNRERADAYKSAAIDASLNLTPVGEPVDR